MSVLHEMAGRIKTQAVGPAARASRSAAGGADSGRTGLAILPLHPTVAEVDAAWSAAAAEVASWNVVAFGREFPHLARRPTALRLAGGAG
jgi:hypothetical protein